MRQRPDAGAGSPSWRRGPAGPWPRHRQVCETSALTLGRCGLVMAPLLLAMYGRKWWPQADVLYLAVPALAAGVRPAQARLAWQVLRVAPAAAPA